MSTEASVEFLLHTIDEACQEWQQKFQTITPELLQSIQQILDVCTEYLIELSKCTTSAEQVNEDRLGAQRIVSKLKQLRDTLGNLWPTNIKSFTRDIFDAGLYHVKALEYFHPVPFYPNLPILMKLYEWSVYGTDGTIASRYFLEKSEFPGGLPFYVLGKTFTNGHEQLEPYGPIIPDYNDIKIQVINNLTGQESQAYIATTFP